MEEDSRAALNFKLGVLDDKISSHPKVAVAYFLPDERKTGGKYVTAISTVKSIDGYENLVILVSGGKIAIKALLEIEGDLFEGLT